MQQLQASSQPSPSNALDMHAFIGPHPNEPAWDSSGQTPSFSWCCRTGEAETELLTLVSHEDATSEGCLAALRAVLAVPGGAHMARWAEPAANELVPHEPAWRLPAGMSSGWYLCMPPRAVSCPIAGPELSTI